MTDFILRAYDFLARHGRICLLSFATITVLLACLLFRIDFKEDISAFLPLNQRQQEALAVYQDVSGASKILAIFQSVDSTAHDPDAVCEAISCFEANIAAIDTSGVVRNLMTEFDLEKLTATTDFVYRNIPYFLTAADYQRIDSLLSQPDFIASQLDADKQLLMFPTSGMLSANLQKDPLNLFSPVVSLLQQGQAQGLELYDGRIFTHDMSRAIAVMESPFGNSETQNNAILMNLLQEVADSTNSQCPAVSVHYIGGPAIAVGNARQIKADSILSIAIALVLIVSLLVVAMRRLWNILLIVVSVSWGWLFALAMIAVVDSNVSLIVIGISSIILGIAVNYPLHLIAHARHTQSMRQVLREIISPLVIGNITTVGAFMALVPLQSVALRDLGLFSAFILVGTILFSIFYLPHAVKTNGTGEESRRVGVIDWLSNLSLENKRWLAVVVLVCTCVFAYYSRLTEFDADMSHINYMTPEQHADMNYFKAFTSGQTADVQCIYVVSQGADIDEALDRDAEVHERLVTAARRFADGSVVSCRRFLPSSREQRERLDRWNEFVRRHRRRLTDEFRSEALAHGFQPAAFDEFAAIIAADYRVEDYSFFAPLSNINSNCLSIDSLDNKYRVVEAVYVASPQSAEARACIESVADDRLSFDVQSMNSAMANGLSDNFNYIGWACGLIVFFFLWLSFGSIELALLSFLPMAVSWIWILGIMGITGIQFNIVNVILATFIFGQGDDYTIFMTEGCCYEYAYRRKMLASYKSSIIMSALIMFIGIGTLILAKHPALRSLAEVTIVGMFSVVLMAYLLPPLVFKWLTTVGGTCRERPLSLLPVLRTWFCGAWWLFQLLCGYVVGFVLFVLFRRTATTESLFRKLATWAHRFDVRAIPGVRVNMLGATDDSLQKPCVIVCNHQSMLDPMLFMAWSPKIIIVANERSSLNPIVRVMFRWMNFYTIRESNFTAWMDSTVERDIDRFRDYIAKGYSIAVFPEGVRNPKSSILRCHKGPFYLAERLQVDILPVLIHGVNQVMPIGSFASYAGTINMEVGQRVAYGSQQWNHDYSAMTKTMHRQMVEGYRRMCRKYENAAYFRQTVIDRYRYKGTEVMAAVRKNLKVNGNYSALIDRQHAAQVFVLNAGYGEMPLLLALTHPDVRVIAYDDDEEKLTIARYSAEQFVTNVEYHDSSEFNPAEAQGCEVIDLASSPQPSP